MRIRNVKNAKENVNKHPLVIEKLDKETFENSNPIKIEVGMGKGTFITTLAKMHPDINFVGIEKYESVLIRALEKVTLEDYPNLRFMRMDATDITEYINIKIEAVYLNFSDPWPKTRHAKRRLTSKNFLDKYETLFNEKIEIFQKTDNKDFFAYSLESLSKCGYTLETVSLDLHKADIANIKTEYEIKFSSKGETINYLHAYKKI